MKFIFRLIIFILLLSVTILVALIVFPNKIEPVENDFEDTEETYLRYEESETSNIKYLVDNDYGIYVTVFDKPIEIIYDSARPNSFRKSAEDSNLLVAINGGYFTEEFTHAGLLALDGEIIEPIARVDTQVTHIFIQNKRSDTFDIVLASDFNLSSIQTSNLTAFQTGPLIIQSSIVQNDFIENSLNGLGNHRRSLLGFTENGEKFFIASKRNFKLDELAEKILEFPYFQDKKITVVNLDGGSSVAMYSNVETDFTFGTARNLPIILGVR